VTEVSASARRVAALYDVHGNLPALEAVLDEVRGEGVDLVVVGGDVVPGPMPRESLERLLDLEMPLLFLRGNGETAVLSELDGIAASGVPEAFRSAVRWSALQLRPEHERILRGWPATVRVAIAGLGDVWFCHATPRSETEIFTRLTPEERLRPVFATVEATLVVCGHTHMQFDRSIGGLRIVNAGSVGLPFGEPGAYWLLLGPGVELRRTRYDLARAAERIRATAYPGAEELASRDVLRPRSEAEMLELFTKNEVGARS
jgi:predicted phosphodiesterase